MKRVIIETPKDKILHEAVCDKFVSLGYELHGPVSVEYIPAKGYPLIGPGLEKGCVCGLGRITNKTTHTLEGFFNLTPEDVQDYKPKTHKVTAKRIKELLGADERDAIEFED